MFGLGKKTPPLNYKQAQPFIDPTFLQAPVNNPLPLVSFLSGTGILVRDSIDAFSPAVHQTINAQVITSIYGEGYFPTDLPVQQMLSAKPSTGNL